MKVDYKRPNGYVKRTQYCRAQRGGISSMGSPYKKGDTILHMSSSRCTGETFVLTPGDLKRITRYNPGEFASPKQWGEELHKEWVARYGNQFQEGQA